MKIIKFIKSFVKIFLKIIARLFLKSYDFDEKLSPQIFGIKDIENNFHHFFVGYYDIDPISKDGSNILCHRVSGKYKNEITPEVGYIGLMSINTGVFKILTKTNALNWQLASRAQWLDESKIIFNDVEKGFQISCKFDIQKNQILKKYKRSFWAISPNKKIGASLNFSRINKKRPGYGYRGKSIDNDIEFFSLFDLDTGEDIYKIHIGEIMKKINFSPSGNDPYLNHVCWAPCSSKLLTIFHFAEEGETPRRVYPIIFDINKKDWYCIDKNSMFSHHVWLDKDNLLAYRREDNRNTFCIWNRNSKWKTVNNSMPKNDGHPSFITKSKKIVLDSYPNAFGIMNIFICHLDSKSKFKKIGYVINKKNYDGVLRCDLHPKISNNFNKIILDIPTNKGRRIILLDSTDV